MKTIGERIRQAREQRRWSGETLAIKVGYKHQSAIGNLEARATGQGGRHLGKIADALGVPVEWLLQGPDSEVVPFLTAKPPSAVPAHEPTPRYATTAEAHQGTDVWTVEAMHILAMLSDEDRRAAVLCLRTFVQNLGPPRNGQALPVAA